MKPFLIGILFGSLLFYLPLIVLHLPWHFFSPNWEIMLLPLMILLWFWMFFTFTVLRKKLEIHSQLVALALAVGMVLGIWLTGPFWMMTASSFSPDAGFRRGGSLHELLWMTELFPVCTFMMSAYAGLLYPLLFVTFVLPSFSVIPRDLLRKRKRVAG